MLLEPLPAETIIWSGYASDGPFFRFHMAVLPIGVIDDCDETNNELVLRDPYVEE